MGTKAETKVEKVHLDIIVAKAKFTTLSAEAYAETYLTKLVEMRR